MWLTHPTGNSTRHHHKIKPLHFGARLKSQRMREGGVMVEGGQVNDDRPSHSSDTQSWVLPQVPQLRSAITPEELRQNVLQCAPMISWRLREEAHAISARSAPYVTQLLSVWWSGGVGEVEMGQNGWHQRPVLSSWAASRWKGGMRLLPYGPEWARVPPATPNQPTAEEQLLVNRLKQEWFCSSSWRHYITLPKNTRHVAVFTTKALTIIPLIIKSKGLVIWFITNFQWCKGVKCVHFYRALIKTERSRHTAVYWKGWAHSMSVLEVEHYTTPIGNILLCDTDKKGDFTVLKNI